MSNSTKLTRKERMQYLSSLPYKNKPYCSRAWGHPFHFLLSYPSKLKPGLAHFLVKLFSEKGDKVLDPFSGVGTIPFEACSQGRIGIGSDINPVAYYATLAKVCPPEFDETLRQINELEDYLSQSNVINTLSENESEIIDFYHKDTLSEILKARDYLIFGEGQGNSFIITCIIHILHGNRPYALSRRSHNIMPWPPKGDFVYKSLIKSLTEKVNRSFSVPLPDEFQIGSSHKEYVDKLPFKDSSIQSILTSPPFHQNRDFVRMNRIRLWFAGWDYNTQKEVRTDFIENHKNITVYRYILKEFYRVLEPSKYCVLHLGVVKNFNMGEEIEPFAIESGFTSHGLLYEDTSDMESHGIRDRGATNTHQFLILQK